MIQKKHRRIHQYVLKTTQNLILMSVMLIQFIQQLEVLCICYCIKITYDNFEF